MQTWKRYLFAALALATASAVPILLAPGFAGARPPATDVVVTNSDAEPVPIQGTVAVAGTAQVQVVSAAPVALASGATVNAKEVFSLFERELTINIDPTTTGNPGNPAFISSGSQSTLVRNVSAVLATPTLSDLTEAVLTVRVIGNAGSGTFRDYYFHLGSLANSVKGPRQTHVGTLDTTSVGHRELIVSQETWIVVPPNSKVETTVIHNGSSPHGFLNTNLTGQLL